MRLNKFLPTVLTLILMVSVVTLVFTSTACCGSEHTNPGTIKVAAVQMEPKIFDKEGNLNKILQFVDEAAGNGAKLIVFPECALTGYVFLNRTETEKVAETIPGPSTYKLIEKAKEHNVYIVVGLVEKDGDKFYNAAILVGPEGYIGKYRKVHPWWPAESAWPVTAGDLGFPVYSTAIGKIGMMICYDAWFPEPARCLALGGADIIAFLTNAVGVPAGFACFDHILQTRAIENHVWIVGADRIGVERDVPFAGRSQIVDIYGDVIVEASLDKEEIIYTTIDVKAATETKQLVPGLEKSDLFWARKPASYAIIYEPVTSELKASISNLENKVSSLEKDLASWKTKASDLEKTVTELKSEVASLQSAASTNLYLGLVGGLIIGLIIGIIPTMLFYRKKVSRT